MVTQIDGDTLASNRVRAAPTRPEFQQPQRAARQVATTSTVVAAASTPFAANFPDANLSAVVSTDDGDAYAYFKNEANKITFYGSAAGAFSFSSPIRRLCVQTPLNYHDAFTDAYNSQFSIPDGGTFSLQSHQSRGIRR